MGQTTLTTRFGPFVCVFEGCTQPDTRYCEQKAWIAHLQSHRMRWTCRLPGHLNNRAQITFTEENAYATHLRDDHGTKRMSDAQIRLLIRQSGRPDEKPLKTCPLCLGDVSRVDAHPRRSVVSVTGVDQPQLLPTQAMQKHLASHLTLIASYSFSRLNDIEDNIRSDAAPSSVTESSDSASSNDSKDRNRPRDPRLVEQHEPLVFEDDDTLPEGYEPGDWNYVPTDLYEIQQDDPVF
jgi:hypothetical protein